MLRGTTRRSRGLATLLAVAVASLAAATPAGAYLRDFQAISVLTPGNSQASKSLPFTCPANKFPLGTGAGIPLVSNLGIQTMGVFYGQRVLITGGSETDSQNTGWQLTNRAWCATSTGVKPNAGGPGPYVKRVVIERNQSSSNSNFSKSVVARCPADSPTVIGGGGNIDGATNDVAFDNVQRLAGGTQLRVKAHETDATGGAWSVEAHAICADITNPSNANIYAAAEIGNTTVTSGFSSVNKTITSTCPGGRSVVGGGAVISGNNAGFPPSAPPVKVVLKQSRPAGDGGSTNQWTATAVEVDPTATAWRLSVRAVCAVLNGTAN